jgi:hypothetical protein
MRVALSHRVKQKVKGYNDSTVLLFMFFRTILNVVARKSPPPTLLSNPLAPSIHQKKNAYFWKTANL